MNIYDVSNIENCTIRPIGDPVAGYRINSNAGWFLHIVGERYYKTAMALSVNFDFSTLEVIAETDLPEGAEILGVTTPPAVTE